MPWLFGGLSSLEKQRQPLLKYPGMDCSPTATTVQIGTALFAKQTWEAEAEVKVREEGRLRKKPLFV